MQFVSIDFETANERRNSPCAVGIAVVDGEEIVDEFYSLINPMMDFSPFNTRVHGITAEDASDAPTFAQLWLTLDSYLSNHMVVAHNASFDMSVIRHTLDYFNFTYPEMDYLCTANISRCVWPDLTNHKLNTVASYHGIRFDHHHALEDARVAAKILIEAFKTYETDQMDIFLGKCGISKGRIYDRGYVPPKREQTKRSRKIYF
ncbi:DNA polymerase-3 subunit epsilon [Lentibacillus halodurans]|uniref:DNA polymerase-3 subunit epsilon n=1 Tax=Lentibacillus halodurans TaxID=237679 RepID=A0A1I0Z6V9_9BACI|nr:3'-5' exonuclease [Lentibacillus halodurans]SFB21489.1 DNA polymerase-3 subunit epsilon [Lentibacillus halodurans]